MVDSTATPAADRIIHQVAVFGLGKVGELVAILLADSGFKVVGYDTAAHDGELAGVDTRVMDVTAEDAVSDALQDVDAVVSCLPFHFNTKIAKAASSAGVHYFDL